MVRLLQYAPIDNEDVQWLVSSLVLLSMHDRYSNFIVIQAIECFRTGWFFFPLEWKLASFRPPFVDHHC